jgi:cell division protein FtsB
MFKQIKNFWNGPRRKQLTDPRNLGLYIFGIIVLAITWSGVKTVQNNYELQKQISTLQQQNQVLYLKKQNAALQNQFYQSDEYLDLIARQDLGLAAPGEKVLLIPQSVAMKYVDPSLATTIPNSSASTQLSGQSKISKNLEDWRDFLLGRKLFSD